MKYFKKCLGSATFRKLAIFSMAFLWSLQSAFPASVTLAWDPSPDGGSVSGYRLHYGNSSKAYNLVTNAGLNTTFTLDGLSDGATYFFAVTAVGTNQLESDYSNEISYNIPAVNKAPTITSIGDQSIAEDSSTSALGFTVGDQESAAESLTLAATSSDTGLVPQGNIVFGGSGASRTVTVTPVAGSTGSAQITITVSDGDLSASESFNLTVTELNDPPTLADIADMTVQQAEGEPGLTLGAMGAGTMIWAVSSDGAAQPQTVNLTGIGTGGEIGQTLTVNASSSNPSLIPDPSVTYTSPDSTGSLNFTPAAGATGTSVITVTIKDNGGNNDTVQKSFAVAVNGPANSAPSLTTVASQTMNEDGVLGPVAFSVNDAQTSAGSLVVTAASGNATLISTPALQLGGSGAGRNITVRPEANQSGKALITLTVTDAQGAMSSRAFWVTVDPVNDAPTLDAIADVTLSGDSVELMPLGGVNAGPLDGVQGLTVRATSSDPSIIADPEVVYYSPSATGELQLKPVAGASGTAVVKVTVTDDGGTANGGQNTTTRTFTVTTAPQVAATETSGPVLGSSDATAAVGGGAQAYLKIRAQDGYVTLTWDSAAGPYELQCSSRAVAGGKWATLTNQPAEQGTLRHVTFKPRASVEFFRLRRVP